MPNAEEPTPISSAKQHIYIPPAFRVAETGVLWEFIQRFSFATLITTGPELFITHLPLMLDANRGKYGTLTGHVARTSPHWKLDHQSNSSIAVFHGPHGYVSPSWYRSGSPAVPTWNYAVVHAIGHLVLIHDPAIVEGILDRMVNAYESGFEKPWLNPMSPEMKQKMAAAVVAFEIQIEQLDGKFKLSQNRASDDFKGAIESLENTGEPGSQALAEFSRQHLNLPKSKPSK